MEGALFYDDGWPAFFLRALLQLDPFLLKGIVRNVALHNFLLPFDAWVPGRGVLRGSDPAYRMSGWSQIPCLAEIKHCDPSTVSADQVAVWTAQLFEHLALLGIDMPYADAGAYLRDPNAPALHRPYEHSRVLLALQCFASGEAASIAGVPVDMMEMDEVATAVREAANLLAPKHSNTPVTSEYAKMHAVLDYIRQMEDGIAVFINHLGSLAKPDMIHSFQICLTDRTYSVHFCDNPSTCIVITANAPGGARSVFGGFDFLAYASSRRNYGSIQDMAQELLEGARAYRLCVFDFSSCSLPKLAASDADKEAFLKERVEGEDFVYPDNANEMFWFMERALGSVHPSWRAAIDREVRLNDADEDDAVTIPFSCQ